MINIAQFFRRRCRQFIILSGLALILLIGILDYLTNPVFSSLVAYLIPVLFVTRFAGRTGGIFMSLASALTWILADILADPNHTFLLVHFWDLVEKLSIFLVVVYILLKLAQVEEERKNLLSMLAHDMKNPALVAKGFATRLIKGKAGPLTEKQLEYIGLVNNELSRLERLILHFLDIARFESKEFKLNPVFFDIVPNIKKHVEAVKVEADKKNITILLDCPHDTVPPVFADVVQIDRVIRNLMGNAIKYIDGEGSITVNLSINKKYVLVQVSDTGPGIAKEHIGDIFKPFYRVKNTLEGVGLGLSIVKSIVKAHGGEMWVDSQVGKGSTFGFTLPREKFD